MRYRWLLGLALLLFAVPVAAQSGPSLRWAQYDNIVEIGSDGEIAISEQQQIVVDQGPLRRMTRTFELAGAQIGTVEVLEDGAPYRRDTNEAPGTFNATTDGANANIRVFFRNPNADRHNLELRYTLRNALVAPDTTQALLDWRFFWGDNAPPVENGSIEVRFPAAVNDAFQFNVAGASVDQTASGNSVRWQLTDQIQGQQVRVEAAFPQSILNAGITLRAPGSGVVAPPAGGNEGGSGNTVPLPNSPDDGVIGVPGDPSGVGGAVAGIGSVFFCAFVLVMLFIVFAVVRSTARGRMGGGTVYGPTLPPVPPVIDPDPFGMGRGRRRRRRYGGYGGSMFPPIFIPPPSPPRQWNDGRDSSPFDGGSGGGGSFWGDSGGGGSSWGSSGGGGSSWGGGGGGGSSWGGGGGSSGSGGGSGGGGGGGGGGSFG